MMEARSRKAQNSSFIVDSLGVVVGDWLAYAFLYAYQDFHLLGYHPVTYHLRIQQGIN